MADDEAGAHEHDTPDAHDGHEHTSAVTVELDEAFVPVRRDGIVQRDTDDGLVLFTPEGGTIRLNSTASILWQFFDGEVTIGELTDDIAAVYDVSRGEVIGDVVDVIRDLVLRGAVLHPAITLGADPDRRATNGASYRPDGCTPCGQHLEDRTWEGKSVVAIGGYHLGIRSSHAAIDAAIRELLADYLVDDPDAPNDFSIWLETDAESGATNIDLFDYHNAIWRSGTMAPIREAVTSQLARYVLADQYVWFKGAAIAGPKGATILPGAFSSMVGFMASGIKLREFTVLPGPVALDPATLELVAGPLDDRLSETARKEFDLLAEWTDGGPPIAPSGRYPLRGLPLVASEVAEADPFAAVANGFAAVDNTEQFGVEAAVDVILQLTQSVNILLPAPDVDMLNHVAERVT